MFVINMVILIFLKDMFTFMGLKFLCILFNCNIHFQIEDSIEMPTESRMPLLSA